MSNNFIDYLLRIRLPIIIFVGLTSFALTYYVSRAERDGVGYTPEQPIAYSHKLHAGEMQIDCEYCHTGVAKTRHASVPAASICMNCHTLARADRPDIRLLADYYKRKAIIPWKRIHRVPDYAYFSHVSHVGKGIECESCHGLMEETVKVSQVNSFTMGSCLTCHRNAQEKLPYLENVQNGPDHCWACHR